MKRSPNAVRIAAKSSRIRQSAAYFLNISPMYIIVSIAFILSRRCRWRCRELRKSHRALSRPKILDLSGSRPLLVDVFSQQVQSSLPLPSLRSKEYRKAQARAMKRIKKHNDTISSDETNITAFLDNRTKNCAQFRGRTVHVCDISFKHFETKANS